MHTIVILQARMGSDRLPGKTMMPIGGMPMVGYLIETLKQTLPPERIWMATSEQKENDPIRSFCESSGIHCFSGSELNVASRYYEILKRVPEARYFFRICGDTPYYGGELIAAGHHWIQKSPYDFVSSIPNRGYPMGCNLELFDTGFFLKHLIDFTTDAHKEHVTGYFYKQPDRFRSKLIGCESEGYRYMDTKFSVDTEEDFLLAKKMLNAMDYRPWKFTIEEKITLQKRLIKLQG